MVVKKTLQERKNIMLNEWVKLYSMLNKEQKKQLGIYDKANMVYNIKWLKEGLK